MRDNQSKPSNGAGGGRAEAGASDRGRERGHGKRTEWTHIKGVRSGAERELPGASEERTLETELTSGGGQSQSRQIMSDRTRTVPESARRCQGTGIHTEPGLPRHGNPHGAGKGGAAGPVTENERSTSYGEGEHQPAKTDRKARD